MIRSNQKHRLSILRKVLPCGLLCAGILLGAPSFAQLNNGMPSKVAVAVRPVATTTSAPVVYQPQPIALQPATELLIQVERTTASSIKQDAQESQKQIITGVTEAEAVESAKPAEFTVVIRKPTPSKIAVAASSTQPYEPVVATQAATELLIPVEPITSAQTPVATQSTARPTIQPAERPIRRRPTPSKVAVAAGKNGEPLYGAELTTATAVSQGRMDALTAYLAAPSKTPIAALEEQSIRSSSESLELGAKSALIIDQDSREVLYSRNASNIMPIASITKLMTAMVVLDAKQNMNEYIKITAADVDTLKNSSSRLAVGARLKRRDLLHLTLMSSENRAAHALSRHYPGGKKAFVRAMNKKARLLGMTQTSYVDPTGLSSKNRSSAIDLVWLVDAAYKYDTIRQLSTSTGHKVSVGKRRLSYINSNRLIDDSKWRIGLQKTGYIREAGYCLVMQTTVSDKQLIMVFLDVDEKKNRMRDAQNTRNWVSL